MSVVLLERVFIMPVWSAISCVELGLVVVGWVSCKKNRNMGNEKMSYCYNMNMNVFHFLDVADVLSNYYDGAKNVKPTPTRKNECALIGFHFLLFPLFHHSYKCIQASSSIG